MPHLVLGFARRGGTWNDILDSERRAIKWVGWNTEKMTLYRSKINRNPRSRQNNRLFHNRIQQRI